MFITISKRGDDRYVFGVGDDPKDAAGSWVWSDEDAAVLGDTPPSFGTFGEAHAFASRLADERPSCVLAKKASFYRAGKELEEQTMSAEDQTVSHYNEQVELVGQRVYTLKKVNSKDKDASNEATAVRKEVEGIRQEAEKIFPIIESESGKKRLAEIIMKLRSYVEYIDQLGVARQASGKPFSSDLPRAVIRAFAEAAMTGIAPRHDDVFVGSADYIASSGTYEVVLSSRSDGDLVKLSFDRNFLLCDVIPCGASLEKCGGRSSTDFLVGYWEPIVNAVGHFHSRGNSAVAVTAAARGRRFCFPGFDMSSNAPLSVVVGNASILGKETWLIKKASLETPAVEAPIPVHSEVVCVNPALPTYKDRTGEVTEVAEKTGRFEYRVDFRRGIGVVWLEDKDVRKVDIGR
jgi:hypothetical protein